MPGGLIVMDVITKNKKRIVLLSRDVLRIKTRIDLLTFHQLKRVRLVCESEKSLTVGSACLMNDIHLIDSLLSVLRLTVLSGNPHIEHHLLTNHSIQPRSTLEFLNE